MVGGSGSAPIAGSEEEKRVVEMLCSPSHLVLLLPARLLLAGGREETRTQIRRQGQGRVAAGETMEMEGDGRWSYKDGGAGRARW